MEKITDPTSGNIVRFTDNSAKTEGRNVDFYPDYQGPEPLMLDPMGAPYPVYNFDAAVTDILQDAGMAGGEL